MGVKKNKKIQKQRTVLALFVLLFILIVISAAVLVYLYSENYINYGPTNKLEEAENVEKSIVNSADVILLNNVLVGGINDAKWVSATKMYANIINERKIEVNMFSKDGNLGKFNTASFKNSNGLYYTTTTKYPSPEEYIAIGNKNTVPVYMQLTEIETGEDDIKNVKKALGKYKFLNGTVNIVECYQTSFAEGELGKIYSVTSDGANIFGVYSAVVLSLGKENYLIKYSYVKDTELSKAWPVYDIKHVIDINGDGKCELILQETTATKINYLVEEYVQDGTFNEVLKVSVDI